MDEQSIIVSSRLKDIRETQINQSYMLRYLISQNTDILKRLPEKGKRHMPSLSDLTHSRWFPAMILALVAGLNLSADQVTQIIIALLGK